jgi:hypothetical protein
MTTELARGTGLNADNITVTTIRDLLSNESKPAELQPVDLLYLAYLMLRKAEDHHITDSNDTLAKRFNCDQKTIVRSRKRLVDAGYIAVERRKGATSAVSINIDNIPAEATLRSKITPAARNLASRYKNALGRLGKKKFPKHFLSNQVPTAQRILDSCGGDEEFASQVIGFALGHRDFLKKSRKSLYELFSRWEKVKSAFDAQRQTQAVPAAPVVPLAEQVVTPTPVRDPLTPAERLSTAIVDNLHLTDPKVKDKWFTSMLRLLNRYSPEKVTEVVDFALTDFDQILRVNGAEGFEKYFDRIAQKMTDTGEKERKAVS